MVFIRSLGWIPSDLCLDNADLLQKDCSRFGSLNQQDKESVIQSPDSCLVGNNGARCGLTFPSLDFAGGGLVDTLAKYLARS